MTDKPLSGFYAALLTPFARNGAGIEDKALGHLIDHLAATELDGLYIGGSTGEAFLMSADERRHLLKVSAEANAGRKILIAHVGDINPQLSLSLISEAVKADYDAVSAVPPFYYGFSFQEIKAHYETLATASDLPFLIYNFPALSGVRFSSDQLASLLNLPNVVGVKNTCSDHFALEQLRRVAPDKAILNGFDETLLAGLALGADGGIGSTYNVHSAKIRAMANALARGALTEARLIQQDINGLIDVLVEHGVIPSLKFIMQLRGVPLGDCRAPFLPLSNASRSALEAAVDKYLPMGDIAADTRVAAGE